MERVDRAYAQSPVSGVNMMQFVVGVLSYARKYERIFLGSDAGTGKTRTAAMIAMMYYLEIKMARNGLLVKPVRYEHIYVVGTSPSHLKVLRYEFTQVFGERDIKVVKFVRRSADIPDNVIIVLDETQEFVNDDGVFMERFDEKLAGKTNMLIIAMSATPLTNNDKKLIPIRELFYNSWKDRRVGMVYMPSAVSTIHYYSGDMEWDQLTGERAFDPEECEQSVDIRLLNVELRGPLLDEYLNSSSETRQYVYREAASLTLWMSYNVNPHRLENPTADDMERMTAMIDDYWSSVAAQPARASAAGAVRSSADRPPAPVDESESDERDDILLLSPKIRAITLIHRNRPWKMLLVVHLTNILLDELERLLQASGYIQIIRDSAGNYDYDEDETGFQFLIIKQEEDITFYSSLPEDTPILIIASQMWTQIYSYKTTPSIGIMALNYHATILAQTIGRIARMGSLPRRPQAIFMIGSYHVDPESSERVYHYETHVLNSFILPKTAPVALRIQEMRDLSILRDYIQARPITPLDPGMLSISESGPKFETVLDDGRPYGIDREFPIMIDPRSMVSFGMLFAMLPSLQNMTADHPLRQISDYYRTILNAVNTDTLGQITKSGLSEGDGSGESGESGQKKESISEILARRFNRPSAKPSVGGSADTPSEPAEPLDAEELSEVDEPFDFGF